MDTREWVPGGAGGGGGGGGKGGGGGGGGQQTARAAVEAPDSIRSKAVARVIDLLSEGQISGLVNGLRSIYLNDTPVQNLDGSYNFQNFAYVERTGTQAQGYIPGFPASENAVSVNTKVTFGTPIIHTVSNVNINYVLVTIGIPQLFSQDTTTGDINGTAVQFAIDVQANGGGYTGVYNQVINAKTKSRYQHTVRLALSGTAPWDIRVRRLTADSGASSLQNETWYDICTEGIDTKLKYPNSALVGFTIDAEQFQSIPTRGYEIKGMLVKIPANYNPTTRVYTGVWDGTFTVAWTNNPAWVWYDLVINTRYGLGAYIPEAQVDKWTLYTIAQYCDRMVSDGFGGTEPLFTCNLYIQNQDDAIKVIQSLASTFRGMAYWASGLLVPVQDAPASAAALFTNSNVQDGLFSYSGSAKRSRHTVAMVKWNDPKDMYREKTEYVPDNTGIARYGISEIVIPAVGCTSRGQAHRIGLWTLYTERLETETITFRTALEGLVVRPGDVFKVQDADRAGKRVGGRLLAATTTTVLAIDTPLDIETGKTYSVDVMMPGGTVQNRSVINAVGTGYTSLTLASPLGALPTTFAQWVVTVNDLSPQLFRCLTVDEVGDNWVEIVALVSNQSKYGAVESGWALEVLPVTTLSLFPTAPTSLVLSDHIALQGSGDVVSVLVASWTPPTTTTGGINYLVEYRKNNGNWTAVPGSTGAATIDIVGVVDGAAYDVRITTINSLGNKSATTLQGSRTIVGKLALPSDVTGFSASVTPYAINLSWNEIPDLDHDQYEIWQGSSFGAGTKVFLGRGHAFADLPRAVGSYTYYIKAIDTTGNYSTNSTSLTVTINAIGAPTVSGSNNGTDAQLSWAPPTTQFAIDQYEVRYGASFGAGAPVGTAKGNYFKLPVTWTGSRQFWVAAYDVAGNVGTAGSFTFTVNAPSAPTASSLIDGQNYVINWTAPASTLPITEYEIRYGASFGAGVSLGRVKGTTFSGKVDFGGSRQFWIAAYDANGTVGTAGSTTVNITSPSAPSITNQVIDNNVLLQWTDATQTLPLDTYEVRKGSVYASAAVVGTVSARFDVLFETAAGTYTYWIVGVDSAGNYGTPQSVTLSVNQPPDYVLYATTVSQLDSTSQTKWLRTQGGHYRIVQDNTRTIATPNPPVGLATGAVCVEAWYMPTTFANTAKIADFQGATTGGWSLFVDSGGNAKFGVFDTATQYNAVSTAVLVLNVFVHLVGVYDGTTVQLYLNGVLQATTATHTVTLLTTGAAIVSAYSGGAAGYLAGLRVYARNVNATEAAEHYRAIYKSETSIVGAWDFEEGAGIVVNDDTDNNNNLALLSTPPWSLTALDGRYDLTAGSPKAYYPVDPTRTFAEHFTDGGYTTTQGIITAGYTHGLAPAPNSAQYVEVIDYGTVLAATKITAVLNSAAVIGSVTVTPKISVKKLIGDAWTDFAGVWSIFTTQFRYVKITLDITSAGGSHIQLANELDFRLDVKLINDAGNVSCLSTDVGGTQVNFAVSFVNVTAINVTVAGTTPLIGTYDFVSVPNPTGFKVLLFDRATGARASGTASWAAKGV